MKNYKQLMEKVDAMLAKQDKKIPLSASSGLLSPSKSMKEKPEADDSPEASIAKYIAIIRKKSKGITK